MSYWRPIDDAPRDGTHILISRGARAPVFRAFWDSAWVFIDTDGLEETALNLDGFYFIPCPEFPKFKIMIDGIKLLEHIERVNSLAAHGISSMAFTQLVQSMVDEARDKT